MFSSSALEALPLSVPAQLEIVKPAIELLGPYPILQFFAALIILCVVGIGGIAWLKGEKLAKAEAKTPPDAPRSQEAAVQLFFDGPLKATFDVLHEIQTAQATNKLELKDQLLEALSANRHLVFQAIDEATSLIVSEVRTNRTELSARNEGIHNELRSMRDLLVRLDALLPKR
jgi:hypothetical protein